MTGFYVRAILAFNGLIRSGTTDMHGLAVYVKEGLHFARDLPLENSADSYLCFRLALLHSLSYFFFLYRSPFSSLCKVFDSVSSNIDEVLSFNPPANLFVNVYHKDWLTYSGGTDKSGELCYMTLLRWLTFLLVSQTVILTVLLFWMYVSICSTMVFPTLGNSDHVVGSVSIDVTSYSQWDAPFHRIAYEYSRAN